DRTSFGMGHVEDSSKTVSPNREQPRAVRTERDELDVVASAYPRWMPEHGERQSTVDAPHTCRAVPRARRPQPAVPRESSAPHRPPDPKPQQPLPKDIFDGARRSFSRPPERARCRKGLSDARFEILVDECLRGS